MPRTITVKFDDGSSHVYEGVPDQVTPDEVEQRAMKEFSGRKVVSLDGGAAPPAQPTPEEPSLARQAVGKLGGAEAALQFGSSIVATPVAGLAGLLTAGANLAAVPFSDVTVQDAVRRGANVIERGSQALTYQPRTEAGKVGGEAVSYPFQKLAEGADYVGDAAARATGSPAVGAAVNTGIQALPALLFRGRSKPAQQPGASGARPSSSGAQASASASAQATASARVDVYINQLGLNPSEISGAVKAQLTKIAEEAGALEKLDPEAVKREAKFQSLPVPVPATRGTLARDPVAMRNEAAASATDAGRAIYDTNLAANDALIKNLEVLKGQVSGTGKTAAKATTREQTGEAVQGAARAKLKFQQGKVKELYKRADEAGETAAVVPDKGLLGIMDVVRETVDQPHFSYAKSWLEDNAKKIDSGQLSIRDIESLRQQASARALNGGTDKFYARELIKAIDQATDGAGGQLYKEARAARNKQALEFEDQAAVADLVDNSSRTDRATALENTTKAILNGSLEDVRKVKRTLLTGGDPMTRTAGRQAWREVRSQVIEDIKSEATKGVALNKDGTPNLSAAQLKSVVDKYRPKLDEIFGPGTAKQLDKIVEVARDAKTQPPRLDAGSSTFANMLAFLAKGLDKVPGGGIVVDVARGTAKVKELGSDARAAAEAKTTPLNEALNAATRRAKIGKFEPRDKALIPLSQLGQRKDR